MTHEIFTKRTPMPVPVEQLFAYHERPGAFMRLNPPWEPVEVLEHTGGIQDGAKVDLKLSLGPVPVRWLLTHQNYQKNRQFEDIQVKGPFNYWRHTHRTLPEGEASSILEDRIEYELPLGVLGKTFGGGFSRAKLERMFKYRHAITLQDLKTHAAYPTPPLRIAVTGTSGLVGSQLIPFLTTGGHTAYKLVRQRASRANCEIAWNPAAGTIDADALAGMDAVIHLAGDSIAEGRWTDAKKQRILASRLTGTRLIAETLANMPNPPKVLICASAIGYYGDRGSETLTEDSAPGDLFLSDVCQQWEAATAPAREAGIRVVIVRFGIILSMSGGALAKMLLPFQMGAGGVLGSGEQYMSWIALDDAIGAIYHAMLTPDLSGVVNLTAPHPVTNREFTRTMSKVLFRPAIAPVPAAGMRVAFGQMADELLLASTRVLPTRLEGYAFRYPQLEPALRHILGR